MQTPSSLYGVLAEFDTPDELLAATRGARQAGYRQMDAYTPFPVEGLAEALGFQRTGLPFLVLLGGIVGGIGGYLMQYWIAAIDYPLNVGGRPLHSWPSFIPVTFELTILVAAARTQWVTDALSPPLQCAAFRTGDAQQLFLMHRGQRSQIRPRRDEAVPGKCQGAGGLRR
jgi:hypothetical protein